MINFKGPAKRIDDIDLPRIGAEIGVGEDEIHAVIDVETAGGGIDSKGRLKMLFEPHIFYRHLSGAKRDRAVAEGLAYPKWKRSYPKDSYPRLKKAMAIDETAALKSASWGLGQILGQNHKLAGYATPQAMVTDFVEGEAQQLRGMVMFIKNTGLADKLHNHDWAGFARGYNGAGYAANKYDKKLAAAYAKWAKIPDTPYKPEAKPKTVTPAASSAGAVAAIAAVAGGAGGLPWWHVALIAAGCAVVAFAVIYFIRRKK